jgi:hypothetical protein
MTWRLCARRTGPRRGITIIEIGAASVMLAILLASTVQVLRALDLRQRAMEERALALQAVQNLAEQIGNLPWEQITQDAVRQLVVPESFAARVPRAEVVAEITDQAEPLVAKRVSVELSWPAPDDQVAKSVRLTSWVFPAQSPLPLEEGRGEGELQ